MEQLRENTCCFTGHRVLPKEQLADIQTQLYKVIRERIKEGYCWFAAGGAKGFDTLAAQSVLNLKKEYPHIYLYLILPHAGQENSWSESQRALYREILEQADRAEYISDVFVRGCMQARNRRLVEVSSSCIAYMTRFSGGTYYTVNAAEKQKVPVENLACLIK